MREKSQRRQSLNQPNHQLGHRPFVRCVHKVKAVPASHSLPRQFPAKVIRVKPIHRWIFCVVGQIRPRRKRKPFIVPPLPDTTSIAAS
jgi:hypothetical protein